MSEGKKVESRRKDRTAIKVGGEWYPCTKEVGEFVNNGDTVTVEEAGPETNERDGKKIIKKVKIVERGYQPGKSGGNGGSGGGKKGGFDNVGMEVGHAYNVAAQLAVAKHGKDVTPRNVQEIAEEVYPVVNETKDKVRNGGLKGESSQAPQQEASEPETGGDNNLDEDPPF